MPIDILAGSATLRRDIEAGRTATDIASSWEAGVEAFEAIRRDFLLY